MIKNFLKDKWQRFKKWIVWLVIGSTVLAAPLLLPDHSFENLSNVEKIPEQALYRISFDEWSEVEIPEVEIPTAKLKKWKDETYIKISYPDFDKKIKPKQEDKKLKWKGKDMEVHLYPLEPREFEENGHTVRQLENGGFEFEIILKKKPKTNVITLDIETKGLRFYHQPELTQEEIDRGAFRPENVVGSYAIYHETQDKFFKTKKEGNKYRTGKAFHIYRPRITDAVGNWAWSEQEIIIDENGIGQQIITIPQDFLDNAVYPIRHAGGDTFGNETIEATTDAGASDYILGLLATPAGSGTANSITFYLVSGSYDDGPQKLGLYKGSDGTFVGGTAEQSGLVGDDWNTVDLEAPQPSITAQEYYIVHFGEEYSMKYDAITNAGKYSFELYPAEWPSPETFYSEHYKRSIYCTYTPSAPPPAVEVEMEVTIIGD